ncbi:MAG: zinc metallopeptidase [Verrucomicrobiota bacterium]|nr:zinc metallopeptidase [Verrucomicrobiota bacterium]
MSWYALTWVGIIFAMVLGLYAQWKVGSTVKKFSKVTTRAGYTGAEVARQILRDAGISDVEVKPIAGEMTDHYDPTKKVLCLSEIVYGSTSAAAVGIAAHECGHALQHKAAYAPLHLRMAIVPVTQFASGMLPIVMMAGYFFHMLPLTLMLGSIAYGILAIFQLVTLPVEFDASSRAKRVLRTMGLVDSNESDGVSKVLNAAALTYVAAFVSSLAWLLHFLLPLLLGGRRQND